MRRVVLALACCLAVATALRAQPLPARVDAAVWRQADQLARSGRHPEALQQFKRALGGSGDAGAFRSAGLVLRNAGAPAEAEALWRWARKKLRRPDALAVELAELYRSQSRHAEAVREWSLALRSGSPAAAGAIEAIAAQAGYGETARWMERHDLPDDAFQRAVAELWLKAGLPERAWARLQRMSDHRLLSAALSSLLDRPEVGPGLAARFIRDLLQRDPPDRASWVPRLAQALADDARPEEAVRLLEDGAAGARPEDRLLLARLLLRDLHRPDRARGVLDAAGPGWMGRHQTERVFLKAEAMVARAGWDSARQALAPLADSAQPPEIRQRALLQLGEIAFLLQDFGLAEEHFGRVAALGPGGDAVNDALARLLLISGAKTDRMRELRGLAEARSLQARFLFAEADRRYRELAEQAPGSPIADEALVGRAEAAVQQRDHRRAAQRYAEAGQQAGDSALAAEAMYRSGRLWLERLGDPGRARRAWQAGILRYPDTSWADLMRGGLERLSAAKPE